MKNRPPTDLEILEYIYAFYYPTFISYSKDKPTRTTKVHVPIDVEAIANHFSVDIDIIFGRLYYSLEPKYGFTQPDGAKVHFFALKLGDELHSVQFPLLAAVLADLREERNKHLTSIWISIGALIISIISLVLSIALPLL